MSEPLPPLEVLAEDFERVLCIPAHPDDMEYGAAAAVARWVSQGKHVAYALVTSGEAGIDSLDPEQAKPLREAEQRAACAAVGVDAVEFLGFPDGVLEYGLPLRRGIAAAIRRHRPDIVVTVNQRDSFGPGMLNMADHIVTGRAVVDAARDAGNRWVFRDLLDEGLEPWNKVRMVLASGSPEATHAVDIDGFFEAGIASLKAHEAYLAAFGEDTGQVEEMLEGFARMAGSRIGVKLATSFEAYPINLL